MLLVGITAIIKAQEVDQQKLPKYIPRYFSKGGLIMPKNNINYKAADIETLLKQLPDTGMLMIEFRRVYIAADRMIIKRTLTNDTVANFINTHFSSKLIDITDTSQNLAIAQKYNVTDWEFIFLDKKGVSKYSFGGGWTVYNSKSFMEQINGAVIAKKRVFKDGVVFKSGDVPAAFTAAAKSNKLVLIDCYTHWCVPCTVMANNVFPLKQMGDYFNPKFVADKLDMETPEGKEFNKKYKVTAYPTFLILNTKGEEIGRIVGGEEATPFIAHVADVLSKK